MTQDRLEVALEGTETGSFEWHVADDRLRWSANLAPLWGRERGWAPADYEEYLATIAPEDRPGMVAAVERVLREGGGFDLDFRVDGADGRRRWMHTRTHVLRGEDGTPSVLVGLVADATTRKRRELASAFLAEATLALSASLDPEATLRQVAESAVPTLADWCAVHVLAEGGAPRRLAVAHTEPHKEELVAELERRYPPDPDAATGVPAVLRTGRPELYPVVGDDLLAAAAVDDEHLGLLRRLALHSGLVVPIVAHGRVLGAMTFAYADSERTYGDEDLALAEELGRRAGTALENARLHDAERRARDRLQRLQAVTDVGLTHLGLDELMPELLRRVRDLCDGDFAVLLLLDERGEALAVEAAVGLEEEVTTGVRIPVGRGVAGRIAARGRPEVIDDLHAREVISPYLRERGRSLVGVPLRDAGRVVGVLHVSSHEPGHFSAADVELLELVADRVTRAVSHARVYAATRDIALTLQRSLLPEALAVPEGYEAAARYLPGTAGVEVGGDWYDLFRLGDGRRAIVVGDVAGRGTGAAAAMGTLRAALRAHLHHAAAPADALMRVDALLADTSPGLYATAVVLVLDPASGELVAATAGHPPPLLRGPGGCRAVRAAHGAAARRGPPARGVDLRPAAPARPSCSAPTASSSVPARPSTSASSACGRPSPTPAAPCWTRSPTSCWRPCSPTPSDPTTSRCCSCAGTPSAGARLHSSPPGAWRSLVSHLVWDEGIVGSNPAAPIEHPRCRAVQPRAPAGSARTGQPRVAGHSAHEASRRHLCRTGRRAQPAVRSST